MTDHTTRSLGPIPEGDAVYARLMEAHSGLSDAESAELNTKLVLILAAEIGDSARLHTLIDLASETASNSAPLK